MRRHQCHADPLRPRRGRPGSRGITLLELMLSVALGVVVLVAATVMLLSASRMRRNQQLLSDANQEARTALRHVARTLASAGAGGNAFSFVDADGNVQTQTSVISFKNGAGLSSPPYAAKQDPVPLKDVLGNPVSTSITTTTMKQQPDEIIVLHYAGDRRTELLTDLSTSGTLLNMTPDPRDPATPGVVPAVFLTSECAFVTNFTRAMLLPVKTSKVNVGTKRLDVTLDMGSSTKTPADLQDASVKIEPGAAVFPVRVIRYRLAYVPKQGTLPERTDLLMETLDPSTMLQTTPKVQSYVVLARDVEDFQVQWGYDYNGDGVADLLYDVNADGIPDGYVDQGPAPKAMDGNITFARINLSVRTSTTLLGDKGDAVPAANTEMTPFELGLDTGMGGTPLDKTQANGYRRRIMSAVVALKNVAATRI